RVTGGRDAGQRSRAGEGPGDAVLHRAAVVLGSHRDDLEAQVGDRLQQAADELSHALWGLHVDLAAHVLAPSMRPQSDGRVEVTGADRIEVAARNRLGLAAGY